MKETPLSKRIADYIQRKGTWVHKGTIEELAKQAGYLADNAARRCRELESGKLSDGKTCPIVLEKKIVNGTVWYRHLQGAIPIPTPQPKVVIKIINNSPVAVCV